MSTPILGAPELSNKELIELRDRKAELAVKLAELQAEINKTKKLIDITNCIAHVHLDVPISIEISLNYTGHGSNNYVITNVTPAGEQYKSERKAIYLVNKLKGRTMLTCYVKSGEAQVSVLCSNPDTAKQIALDYVATGKFPSVEKLLCQFKRDAAI